MLPCRKVRMRWHDLDRAPAIFEIGGFALLDFGLLRRPKGVAVRKIAIFLEQVGDDLTRIVGHVEQRRLDRTRPAAEQPRPEKRRVGKECGSTCSSWWAA